MNHHRPLFKQQTTVLGRSQKIIILIFIVLVVVGVYGIFTEFLSS